MQPLLLLIVIKPYPAVLELANTRRLLTQPTHARNIGLTPESRLSENMALPSAHIVIFDK
jgi:hypothetical protein